MMRKKYFDKDMWMKVNIHVLKNHKRSWIIYFFLYSQHGALYIDELHGKVKTSCTKKMCNHQYSRKKYNEELLLLQSKNKGTLMRCATRLTPHVQKINVLSSLLYTKKYKCTMKGFTSTWTFLVIKKPIFNQTQFTLSNRVRKKVHWWDAQGG